MKKIFLLLFVVNINCAYAATAIFVGGCFWCMQSDFDKLAGVTSTAVGYDGGTLPNPNYKIVSSHNSGYSEAVMVTYNDKKLSYPKLVSYFLHHVDPTDSDGQFCDKGPQYTTKIFYLNDSQKQEAMKQVLNIKSQLGNVYTKVLPSTKFYIAEEYHQKYYQKNPNRYEFYRWSCGRDSRVRNVWHEK